MKKIFIIIFSAFLVFAFGYDAVAQSYQGTGDKLGSGWKSDDRGGSRGTGDNLGSGYRYQRR